MDSISGDVRTQIGVKKRCELLRMVFVACGMAQSKEGTTFSPLESLATILRKLSAKEFASERVLRHSAIRRQIQSLLQSPAELQSLSSALHEDLLPLISSLPSQKGRQQSFQVQLWPKFHVFRVREVPRIWRNCQQAISDVDPILTQKATLEYALVLLHIKYGGIRESSVAEEKETRRGSMSLEEENAIRYAAGYVLMKMKKMYKKRESVSICCCLLSMEEGTTKDEDDEAKEESFLEYTCAWLQLINRGGLFTVRDEVYNFFLELELCMYPMLKSRLGVEGSSHSKNELVQTIKTDEDVLFAWSLITVDLSRDDSGLLLTDVIHMWITIRGFSIASKLIDDYKESTRLTTKGKKALRRQLLQQSEAEEQL